MFTSYKKKLYTCLQQLENTLQHFQNTLDVQTLPKCTQLDKQTLYMLFKSLTPAWQNCTRLETKTALHLYERNVHNYSDSKELTQLYETLQLVQNITMVQNTTLSKTIPILTSQYTTLHNLTNTTINNTVQRSTRLYNILEILQYLTHFYNALHKFKCIKLVKTFQRLPKLFTPVHNFKKYKQVQKITELNNFTTLTDTQQSFYKIFTKLFFTSLHCSSSKNISVTLHDFTKFYTLEHSTPLRTTLQNNFTNNHITLHIYRSFARLYITLFNYTQDLQQK